MFHREEAQAAGFAELVYVGDVGMAERGRELRFLDEPAGAGRVAVAGEDFERDFAAEADVARQVDLAHAAAADAGDDAVMVDHGAGN